MRVLDKTKNDRVIEIFSKTNALLKDVNIDENMNPKGQISEDDTRKIDEAKKLLKEIKDDKYMAEYASVYSAIMAMSRESKFSVTILTGLSLGKLLDIEETIDYYFQIFSDNDRIKLLMAMESFEAIRNK